MKLKQSIVHSGPHGIIVAASLSCGDACSYFLERMVTRSTSIQLTKLLHGGHVFHSKEKLPSEKLPIKRDIIERVLNEENFLQQSTAGWWQRN